MARIRTIKPEFWSDEKVSALEPVDRLVFLGLISLADDFGRVHDLEKVIDAFIFPNTSHSVRESLANLSRMVRIRRGKASNGKPILEIVNWSKHQRVDKPQPKMALPPIDTITNENVDVTPIRESLANDSGMVRDFGAPRPPTTDLRTQTTDQKSETVIRERKKRKTKPETLKGFDEWYAIYPKKVAKSAAEKAYPNAVAKIQATECIDESQSVALLFQWTHERLPSLLSTEIQFRPNPATWLNDSRYRDEVANEPELSKGLKPFTPSTGDEPFKPRERAVS